MSVLDRIRLPWARNQEPNMSRVSHTFKVTAGIPKLLPPEEFIEAIHQHENVIMLQALTTGFKERETPPEMLKDPHFSTGPSSQPIVTYSIDESVVIIPGVSWAVYPITFPAVFQNTAKGLKVIAHASAGVVVKAEYAVEKANLQVLTDSEEGSFGDADWVLTEEVTVECHWMLMPFVKQSAINAHKNICRLVVEKVVRKRQEGQLDSDSRRYSEQVPGPQPGSNHSALPEQRK
ncbi:hypothetical protein B0O99DRAFT_629110 [Bisporella sp. PMI_857]|nr:hypothetical protein B0O99DRAFT_629110 [Bisporella sp. PMI_857]